jgi:hypothetical protein
MVCDCRLTNPRRVLTESASGLARCSKRIWDKLTILRNYLVERISLLPLVVMCSHPERNRLAAGSGVV